MVPMHPICVTMTRKLSSYLLMTMSVLLPLMSKERDLCGTGKRPPACAGPVGVSICESKRIEEPRAQRGEEAAAVVRRIDWKSGTSRADWTQADSGKEEGGWGGKNYWAADRKSVV